MSREKKMNNNNKRKKLKIIIHNEYKKKKKNLDSDMVCGRGISSHWPSVDTVKIINCVRRFITENTNFLLYTEQLYYYYLPTVNYEMMVTDRIIKCYCMHNNNSCNGCNLYHRCSLVRRGNLYNCPFWLISDIPTLLLEKEVFTGQFFVSGYFESACPSDLL